MNYKEIFIAMAAIILLGSCNKDTQPAVEDIGHHTGNVILKFENFVGNQPLSLQNSGYSHCNAQGDSFQVSTYKYYVSNFRLVNADGEEYAIPDSYYLIDQSNPTSFSRNLAGVPAGSYGTIKVLLGVDSTHNVSGAQGGDLDPMLGMFWTWSTGYIMAKVEGNFKKTDGNTAGMSFHLGGFSGTYSVLRELSLSLPQTLVVAQGTESVVTFKSDILKWFDNPNMIDFQSLNQVGAVGPDAAAIADNYRSSLSVISVGN